MAVVTTKSLTVTNRDATPPVINDGRLERAALRSAEGVAAVVSGDSIASKYILCSLPSTAIVRQVLLSCTAITTCAGDIGVYRNTVDGGAVVLAALFGAAQSLAAVLNNAEAITQANYTFAKREQPLWQAAGLLTDPGNTLDIAITLTAAAGSAGTVQAVVNYADNGN